MGTNNFIQIQGNDTISDLDGSGTVQCDIAASGTTFTLAGDMSAFSGTIRVGSVPNLRFNPSPGSANAIFDLGSGATLLNNRNGIATVQLGALIGGPSSQLQGASSANSTTVYAIGGRNLDTTFAGTISQVSPARIASITKVGTGTLVLSGNNTHTGPTTINGGILLVNNSAGSGTGSNSVTVATGGALGGTGFIRGAVTVNSGGTLAPGAAGVGTLTIRSNLTLNSGAILRFELGAIAASDRVVVSNALVLAGTLNLTNVAGFGPGTFTLFNYGGALSGTLPAIGAKPAGYFCTILTNTPGQVRLLVQAQTPPVFAGVSAAGGALVFAGSGGAANTPYWVLTATNLALPLN